MTVFTSTDFDKKKPPHPAQAKCDGLCIATPARATMKLPSCIQLEDGRKIVSVPLDALNVAIAGGRAALAEKKALTLELAQLDAEALALEASLHTREDQLERCASFRPDLHRPRAKSSPRAFFSRNRSKTLLLSPSSIRDLLGEQAEELNQLLVREESVSIASRSTDTRLLLW